MLAQTFSHSALVPGRPSSISVLFLLLLRRRWPGCISEAVVGRSKINVDPGGLGRFSQDDIELTRSCIAACRLERKRAYTSL